MKKVPIFIVFIFCLDTSGAQTANLDSLKSLLNTTENLQKVHVLKSLFRLQLNSNPQEALDYTNEALEIATLLGNTKEMATAFNNLGVIYKNQGVFDKALEYYILSLKHNKEIGNTAGVAYTLGNIGTVYSLKSDYEMALKYFGQAKETFKSVGDKEKMIGVLNNLGNVHNEKGDYTKALEYYQEALTIYEGIEIKHTAFNPMNNIGNIYFHTGDLDKALENYQKSLSIEVKHNNTAGQAFALNNIGAVYFKKNDLPQAEKYQMEALSFAKKIEANPLLRSIYKALSETYYQGGKLKEAYETRLLYDDARDYVFNEESTRKLAQLEVALELNYKEKEVQLLKKQNLINSLEVKNLRIIIILSVMAVMLIVAFGFIIYSLNRDDIRLIKLK